MTFIQPLDLEQLFLVVIAGGNTIIFVFLAMIAIAAIAARFRMPNSAFLMILVLFGVIMFDFLGGLGVLLLLIGGFLTFAVLANLFR